MKINKHILLCGKSLFIVSKKILPNVKNGTILSTRDGFATDFIPN